MQRNSNLAGAIYQGKCPRCRKGNMFSHSATNLSHFAKMNEKCEFCGLRFEVEPGFFYGAMYISYAFSIAMLVAVGVSLSLLTDAPVWVYLLVVSGLSILLLPISFRYSRILFLHFFGGVHFDPEYSN